MNEAIATAQQLIKNPEIMKWALPVSFILESLIVGWIFEKIVLHRLQNFLAKTKWKEYDPLIKSLRRGIIFLFFLGGVYVAILNFPLQPEILPRIESAFSVIIIIVITVVAARVAAQLVHFYFRRANGTLQVSSILTNVTKLLVFILGGLMILNRLGIAITPILTALGVGGLAVALALQSPLANLFAGLQIIISKHVHPGDYIKLNTGEEGYVMDITSRTTRIKTISNNMIIIPNATFANALVTNYNEPGVDMSVVVEMKVSLENDLEKVERVTTEVAKEAMRDTDGSAHDFEPFVRFIAFADSSVTLRAIMRAREFMDQYKIKHEFIKRLQKRFKVEGIKV